jgi:phosphopantetheinyl transferase
MAFAGRKGAGATLSQGRRPEKIHPWSRGALLNEVSASAFSRVERAVLSAAEPNEALITFYRIWVRKEAVLKGEACGLGGCLQSFSVARRQVARTELAGHEEGVQRDQALVWPPLVDGGLADVPS